MVPKKVAQTAEKENELEKYLLRASKKGFGKTRQENSYGVPLSVMDGGLSSLKDTLSLAFIPVMPLLV